MALFLSDFEGEIKRQMRDGAEIVQPADIKVMLKKALETYSKKKPTDVVVDVASDGSGDFAISALAGFDKDISGDPVIEYPISTAGRDPSLIDRRDWRFYDKPAPTGRVIRFQGVPNGQQVRFSFKGIHSVTAIASTVPDSDFYAVCKLAAAEGLEELAAHFTQTSENSFLNADVANYQSKPDQYQKRAGQLRKEFNEHIGAGSAESGTPAASVTTNWDTRNSMGGDRITHPRSRR